MPTILELLNSKYTVFVGSSPESDIVFSDPDISPRHCQISKVGDNNFLVVDLASTNGTFVNNKKIEKEFITETDFISVGSNIFQLTKKVAGSSVPVVPEPVIAEKPPASPSEGPHLHSSSVVTPTPAAPARTKVSVYFLSAPEDENICRAIDKHLSTVRSGSAIPIEFNGDYKMEAGENIAKYRQRLFEADIVLVFVSVDLLNNDECYARLKKVIENHNNRKTTLLPILARNCMWKATPFANLPLLPKNQQPLNNKQFWNSEDDALTEVVNDIYKAINDFSKPTPIPEKKNQGGENRVVRLPSKPILEIDWRKNYLWKVFWKRVAASLLDGIIIGIPLFIIYYMMAGNVLQAQDGDYYDELGAGMTEDQAWTLIGLYLVMVIIQIFIYAFMESSKWRGTPGKRIMKLQITDQAGNPITFGKALIRNVIKLLISGFSNIGNGILVFVYAIAQIIAYTQTKKFFHDQLSNTVIGERVEQ